MAAIDPNLSGQIPASLIPRNLNEQGFVAYGQHIKGGSFSLPYLQAPASDPAKWDDVNKIPILVAGQPVDPDYLPPYRRAPGLLDLHPNVMQENMKISFKQGFERIEVVLSRNPDFINYGDITEDNWQLFWQVVNRFIPDDAQILEFAEEYDGSLPGYPTPGTPPYDSSVGAPNFGYPVGASFDALWETVEYTDRHRWYRIKYIDYDENDTPTVGAISSPIPIGKDSTTFVVEVFKYLRVGEKGVDDPADVIPDTPSPFTATGQPNNNPTGWSDTIPASPSTQYLWRTKGLKELKGDINTIVGWSRPALVTEDAETVRYSITGKPNPGTIVGTTDDVATGTNEADLVAIGWVPSSDYDSTIHNYIATRKGSSGSWTEWKIERITPQLTEFTRRKYKLLPRLSDYDDITWIANNKPTGSDPSDQGWFSEIQKESNFLINFMSEAVFYADNTVKQAYSDPVPFTSQLSFNDYISIHPDNGSDVIDDTREIDDTIIKRFVSGVETHDPEKLWLRAQLFNGNNDVLADTVYSASYQWYKIFDDGEFLTTPEDFGTTRDIQVLNTDVTGRAIFQVQITLNDGTGTEVADAIAGGAISAAPVFTEEISIKDQVDGRDGRGLSASATQPYFIENSTPAYLPNTIIIRAEVDNVDKNDVVWEYLNGSDPINDTWVAITETTPNGTGSPKYLYKNANNDLVLVGGATATATDIFSTVVGIDDIYFRARVPASGALSELQDWVMVSRRDEASITSGEEAFDVHVENPFHMIKVDNLGDFLTGQLADVQAQIEVRKGSTVQAHTAYSVAVVSVSGVMTDTNDVLIGNDGGNKKIITIDEANINWDNAETQGSIVFDVTLSGETKRVYVGLGTVLEPTGFTGLNIVSDRATNTFDYSPGGRDDIEFTAELTRQTAAGNEILAGYNYEWIVVSGRYKAVGVGSVISDVDVVNEVMTLSPDDFDQSAVYRCVAYLTKTGPAYDAPYYVDEVRVNDITDTSTKLLFNQNDLTDPPPLPTNEFTTYADNNSGTDSWYKVEVGDGSETWYSINNVGGAAGQWRGPFKVGGTPGADGYTPIKGVDYDDGADGLDGVDGGIYGWEGAEAINVSVGIAGARVHNLGKIQTDDLAGLFIAIRHTDLETGARVAVGTTTANAVELGVFNGSNNETQWRVFWCPVANIFSETVNTNLYIWSSTADGGTIRKIIVQAVPTGLIGADGVSITGASINGSGQLVFTLSSGGPITVATRILYQTEFRNNGTYIQWKYTHESSGSWRNIILLSDIAGADGITDGITKHLWANNLHTFSMVPTSSWYYVCKVDRGASPTNAVLEVNSMVAVYDKQSALFEVGIVLSNTSITVGSAQQAGSPSVINFQSGATLAIPTQDSPEAFSSFWQILSSARYVYIVIRPTSGSGLRIRRAALSVMELN